MKTSTHSVHLFIYLHTLVNFLLFSLCNSHSLEPSVIIQSRLEMYNNFHNFTNTISLDYDKNKGYYCISTKSIKPNDEIMKVPLNYTFSSFDYFPFKSDLISIIQETPFLIVPNITNNLLLSYRFLFDLKANVTQTFLKLKRHQKYNDNSTEFFSKIEDFKQYIIKRPTFSKKYIQLLPLANYLGQTSWSDDEINEYLYSGSLPIIKGELVKIYNFIFEKVENNTILKDFTSSWLNKGNMNFFLSLYGYVISRTFRIFLKDYDNEDSLNLINDDNLYLNAFGGNILIPFIDLCNHYHPQIKKIVNDEINDYKTGHKDYNSIETEQTNEMSVAKLKLIKLKINGNFLSIVSLSKYLQKSEFSFSYSTLLSNDYLLLNYGFIIRNNPFQEFIFRFDIDDPYKEFYKRLKEINFNMDKIKMLPNNKLVTHFSIGALELSNELFFFIKTYLELNPVKFNRRKPNLIDNQSKYAQLRALALYLITLNRNIYSIYSPKDYNQEFKKLIVDLHLNKDTIEKLEEEVNQNKESDDMARLLSYKNLHTSLKQRNIKQFNLDNIKLLYRHKDLVQKRIKHLILTDIGNYKNQYIK